MYWKPYKFILPTSFSIGQLPRKLFIMNWFTSKQLCPLKIEINSLVILPMHMVKPFCKVLVCANLMKFPHTWSSKVWGLCNSRTPWLLPYIVSPNTSCSSDPIWGVCKIPLDASSCEEGRYHFQFGTTQGWVFFHVPLLPPLQDLPGFPQSTHCWTGQSWDSAPWP